MLSQTPATLQLQVFRGSQLLQTVTLNRESIQIGSLASSVLRIDDPSVGRVHALIENRGPQEVIVSDLGMGGGTRVNGVAIERMPLSPGDEIQLGAVRIVVSWVQPSSSSGEYAKAAEVYGFFEEAVVVNRQLSNPQGNRLRAVTLLLLALGGLSLLGALGSFALLYQRMSEWETKEADLIKKQVPRSLRPAAPEYIFLQVGASVGVLLGVGLLFAGAWQVSRNRREADFTVGLDTGATLSTREPLPLPLFPLVRASGAHYEVVFTREMTGELWTDGRKMDLATLVDSGRATASPFVPGAYVLPLYKGAQVRLQLGNNRFFVYGITAPPTLPMSVVLPWELWCAALVAVAVFFAVVWLTPPRVEDEKDDPFGIPGKTMIVLDPLPGRPNPPQKDKKKGSGGGEAGKRASGEEGKMGKPDAQKSNTGQSQIRGDNDKVRVSDSNKTDDQKRIEARDAAENTGVLGAVRDMLKSNTALAHTMSHESALGKDAKDVIAGMQGPPAFEDGFGAGGFGVVGSGRGGGGTGEGTIALRDLGTIGKGGSGPGPGGGTYGRKAGNLESRKAGAPEVKPGTAEVKGSLDKELVRRVIRNHLNEVKFCYERELGKKPDMQGRATTQFTIGAMGTVLSSAITGLSDSLNNVVGDCIAKAVRRWEFPKPLGGGIVVITYTFVLKPTGSAE